MRPSRCSGTGGWRALSGLTALLPPLLCLARPLGAVQGGAVRSESSTRESATFLLAPLGARAVGLGGAVAASRGVPEAVLWNPASAAALETGELFYLHANDFGTESHVFGGAWPSGGQRLAVAYYRFDLGSIEATSSGGTHLGDLSLRNEAFILALGAPLRSGVEAGVSYKLVRFVSDCSGSCGEFDLSSTGHAFDVGVVAAGPRHSLGLVLRNAGSGLSIGEDAPSDPLPTRLRVGGSLTILGATGSGSRGPFGITVAVDAEETFTEFDDLDLFAGAEAAFHRRLFGRVGYAWSGRGRRGPSLGLGVRLDRVRFDVARSFDDFSGFDGDAPLHLSLGLRL